MSKSLLSIVFVVVEVAVAVFAPELLPATWSLLAVTAATAAIEIGVALVANQLLGPAVPKGLAKAVTNQQQRLYVSMDTTTPRKIVFGGPTAGATDLRYQTYTGTNQDVYWQVIAVASHAVNAISEIWLDNEQAWTAAGGVQGRYVGFLTVTAIAAGTSSNGVAIDSVWTSSCTLTGCAYVVLSYTLSDASDTSQSPFAGGVTNRMTIRCNGAAVYDPRLDSTVAGGSGTQRAATQSTWAWDANGSRNPALQLLWYLLGWDINGKLALGMNIPSSRIDLASFAVAANACDESVTKSAANGGGTEPRYRTDGVMSESDDRKGVIEALCSSMNAVLRDAGGKLSLYVLHNDLATPAASFTESDILGEEKWEQTPDLSSTFNICRGRRVDPSDTALYQLVDTTEVSLTSNDGIDRIDTMDMPYVQSNGQAQRLLKQRLQRKQYQGRYTLTGNARWWQVSIGSVIQLSHQGLGWSNKLFRIASQSIARTGETKIVMVEENAALYAWDNSEAAPVTPGAPTTYDPHNSPILQGKIKGNASTGTNELADTQFGNKWTLTTAAGAVRTKANALSGYAKGNELYCLVLNPSTSTLMSGKSELVPVYAGQRIYFKSDCQRGTTLGTGSRLNMGHEWLLADGVTTTGTPAEGTQQTPSTLTAGAAPKSVYWSDVAPTNAAFVRIKPYTPALASSSGTFRVEAPIISKTDLGGVASVGYGPDSYTAQYNADGTAASGTLPFTLSYILYLGGVAQTSGVTWTYKVLSGGVNSVLPATGTQTTSSGTGLSGTGTGVLTVSTCDRDTTSILISATASNGSTATKTITITKQYAVATGTTGGGGSSGDSPSQTSGFTSFSSTTFAAITNVLTYTIPTGQTSATVTFNIACTPAAAGSGSWTVNFKIQRNISGTWTDVGTAMAGSTDTYLDGTSGQVVADGYTFSGTRQSTSLVAGTQYQFRAVADLSTGTKVHYPTGSISVSAP